MSDRGDLKSQRDGGSDSPQTPDVHPSVFAEIWQSAKYSFVQETYDGISQIGRQLGADIKQRNLVEKQLAPTSTSEKLAQDVGSGIGKIPVIAGMYAMTRLGMGSRAASMALVPSSEASIARLSVAGGLSTGLAIPSAGENLWKERGTQAAAGALSLYTFGKTQAKLSQSAGLLEPGLQSSALSSLAYRAKLGASGSIAGAAGGFVGTETQSILSEHRLAGIEELSRNITASATMGSAFNLLRLPESRTLREPIKITPQVTEAPAATQYARPTMYVPKFEPVRHPVKPEAGEGK